MGKNTDYTARRSVMQETFDNKHSHSAAHAETAAHWNRFLKTGNIKDYLLFSGARREAEATEQSSRTY